MTRAEAVAAVLVACREEFVIAANGMISRELYAHADRPRNFYMLGSMGLACSIGLGLALARPDCRVVVLEGDGNTLMGLGNLAMVGDRRPRAFTHIVLDNESYDTTGGQRSVSQRVALDAVARAAGYPSVHRVVGDELHGVIGQVLSTSGPAFVLVKVRPESDYDKPPRVPRKLVNIATRFRAAVAGRQRE